MLGSPAGPGGPAQRGGLWPLAPAPAPPAASFSADGFGKYGIYSLMPGGPAFGSALYSHSSIGRFAGSIQPSAGTAFHAAHKVADSLFTSTGYTFGAPTPPPGSPYSPVPVTQLELLAKGFNSNIIIQQQPEYAHAISPKKAQPATVHQHLQLQEKKPRCEEKCCRQQRSCGCQAQSPAKTKFLDSPSGCSRTNPVDWSGVCVKKEPGATPCQVAEVTTSESPVVKVEICSPTQQQKSLEEVSAALQSAMTTAGNIPVGIAVARQRIQHHEVVSSPTLPSSGLLATVNTTQIKEMARISELDPAAAMAAAGAAGVAAAGGGGAGGAALLHQQQHCPTQQLDDRSGGGPFAAAPWNAVATAQHGGGSALAATPTLWQYPAAAAPAPMPMEPLVPMPMPPVGFQLVRDHSTGGLLLLPTAGVEQLQQTVVWPSYHQPSSHVLLPPLPPPPLQLLSSTSSDYLQSSTIHQHTQTHSTRLVALTTDTKRKLPMPIPTTTLIKIETDHATLDQTKTLQAVSTIAAGTGTVYTDQNMGPLVTTHVIYQHPAANLIVSTPGPSDMGCKEQATSPVACLTPPPEVQQLQEDDLVAAVQVDASNQTECPDSEEEETKVPETLHEVPKEVLKKELQQQKEQLQKELLQNELRQKELELQHQSDQRRHKELLHRKERRASDLCDENEQNDHRRHNELLHKKELRQSEFQEVEMQAMLDNEAPAEPNKQRLQQEQNKKIFEEEYERFLEQNERFTQRLFSNRQQIDEMFVEKHRKARRKDKFIRAQEKSFALMCSAEEKFCHDENERMLLEENEHFFHVSTEDDESNERAKVDEEEQGRSDEDVINESFAREDEESGEKLEKMMQFGDRSVETAQFEDHSMEKTQFKDRSMEKTPFNNRSMEKTPFKERSVKTAQFKDRSVERAQLKERSMERAQLKNRSMERAQLKENSAEIKNNKSMERRQLKNENSPERRQLNVKCAEKRQLNNVNCAEKRQLDVNSAERRQLNVNSAEKKQLNNVNCAEKRQLNNVNCAERLQFDVNSAEKRQLNVNCAEKRQLNNVNSAERLQLDVNSAERRQLNVNSAEKRQLSNVNCADSRKLNENSPEKRQLNENSAAIAKKKKFNERSIERAQIKMEKEQFEETAQLTERQKEKTQFKEHLKERTQFKDRSVERAQFKDRSVEKTLFKDRCSVETGQFNEDIAERAQFNQNATEKAQFEQNTAERAQFKQNTAEKAQFKQNTAERAQFKQNTTEKAQFKQNTTEKAQFKQNTTEKAQFKQNTAEKAQFEQNTVERTLFKQNTTERTHFKPNATEKAQFKQNTTERAQLKPNAAERVQRLSDRTQFKERSSEMTQYKERSSELAQFKERSSEMAQFKERSSEMAQFKERSSEMTQFKERSSEMTQYKERSSELAQFKERSSESAQLSEDSAETAHFKHESTEEAQLQRRKERTPKTEPTIAEEENSPQSPRSSLDLSGLELLSNSIVEFEKCRKLEDLKEKTVELQKQQQLQLQQQQRLQFELQRPEQCCEVQKKNEVLEGIAQMTLADREGDLGGLNLLCALAEQRIMEEEVQVVAAEPPPEKKKEKRKSKKHHPDEPRHKKSKKSSSSSSCNNNNNNNTQPSDKPSDDNKYSDSSVKQCTCREDSYKTYKTKESEEEVRKFLASKSQSLCCKGEWPWMNAAEIDMRMRLAELQRMYREKQRELSKLKPKKHHHHDKERRKRKKSTTSDRSTPPPVLDKMDLVFPVGKELLKPPTLSRYGSVDDGEVAGAAAEEEDSPKKKRKVGRPKKLFQNPAYTQTLVSKKPKKGIPYLFAAKEKLIQNGAVHSDPPRFVEEPPISPKPKKKKKSKIKPKLKAEPTPKTAESDEEEIALEFSGDKVKEEAEVPEEPQEEISAKKDSRCILTTELLEEDKLRVLTAMGGLFYAGRLNAVEPPDVYSITLDGERGNRPHIMSREEILRDAIVEVSPSTTEELPPGTRLCAYWSQQYRCLYPGSVAEPESPEDPDLDPKFVSVEFDDGDSGRIAIEDIRLLPCDYPIIEYDPNPLLSLSKRRRRTSTTDERRSIQSTKSPTPPLETSKESEVEKENQDVNKQNQERTKESDNDRLEKHREKKRLKKRKREKLKQKLLHEDRKKKKKHRCLGESCKHKKHHKKHRRHHKKEKRHSKDSLSTETSEDVVSEEKDEVEEEVSNTTNTTSESLNEHEEDNSQEDEDDDDTIYPAYHIIPANPEDEVTMDDIMEAKAKAEEKPEPQENADARSEKANSTESGKKKIRDRQESCESRSKMSAFLPARQLWGWSGKGYKRPRGKGRSRKQFFKAIQRGKESIQIGDSAVFLSTGRPDRPYIGRIEAMWEFCGRMVVKVKWFYHPEETIGCPLNLQYPGALFESPHVDENDVQTISHKCEVLPLKDYTSKLGDDPRRYDTIYDNNDIYYLAGYYDPTTTSLKMEPEIPFNSVD